MEPMEAAIGREGLHIIPHVLAIPPSFCVFIFMRCAGPGVCSMETWESSELMIRSGKGEARGQWHPVTGWVLSCLSPCVCVHWRRNCKENKSAVKSLSKSWRTIKDLRLIFSAHLNIFCQHSNITDAMILESWIQILKMERETRKWMNW